MRLWRSQTTARMSPHDSFRLQMRAFGGDIDDLTDDEIDERIQLIGDAARTVGLSCDEALRGLAGAMRLLEEGQMGRVLFCDTIEDDNEF